MFYRWIDSDRQCLGEPQPIGKTSRTSPRSCATQREKYNNIHDIVAIKELRDIIVKYIVVNILRKAEVVTTLMA